MVAKVLFITKRSRPDLDTAVVFLTTRLSKSDVDEWKKLRRIFRFVHCTLKEKRSFGATSIDKIFKCVDESYTVHHEMKIQTGGVITWDWVLATVYQVRKF